MGLFRGCPNNGETTVSDKIYPSIETEAPANPDIRENYDYLLEYDGRHYFSSADTSVDLIGELLFYHEAAEYEPETTIDNSFINPGDPWFPPYVPEWLEYSVYVIDGMPINYAVSVQFEQDGVYHTFVSLTLNLDDMQIVADNWDPDKIIGFDGVKNETSVRLLKETAELKKLWIDDFELGFMFGETVYFSSFSFTDTGINGMITCFDSGYMEVCLGFWNVYGYYEIDTEQFLIYDSNDMKRG